MINDTSQLFKGKNTVSEEKSQFYESIKAPLPLLIGPAGRIRTAQGSRRTRSIANR